MKKQQTIACGGGYQVMQVWKWWDSISLGADIEDVDTIAGRLNNAAVKRQLSFMMLLIITYIKSFIIWFLANH